MNKQRVTIFIAAAAMLLAVIGANANRGKAMQLALKTDTTEVESDVGGEARCGQYTS